MNRIIAISASNSATSINRQLLESVIVNIDDIEFVDLRDYEAPIFSFEHEKAGPPSSMKELATKIREARGVIIATPEHNGSTPAFFKNILDWLSRVQSEGEHIFRKDTPVFLLSTSPGARGGAGNIAHLAQIMPWWGANVVATYSLPSFQQNFDNVNKCVSNATELEKLNVATSAFHDALS